MLKFIIGMIVGGTIAFIAFAVLSISKMGESAFEEETRTENEKKLSE